jgi:hypothetical protein
MGQKFVTGDSRLEFDRRVNLLLDEGYRVTYVNCLFNTYERWWAVLDGPGEPVESMASDAVVAMTKMDATVPQQDRYPNKLILSLAP